MKGTASFSEGVVFSFEAGVPETMTAHGGVLTVSRERSKFGGPSLRWDYEPGSSIRVSRSIGYEFCNQSGTNAMRAAFSIWIYNEVPRTGRLTFQFGNARNQAAVCGFEFGLQYTGWRTAWVLFDRDMTGTPEPGMDAWFIAAPQDGASGTLYLDRIIPASPVDPRYPMRDAQVPFVNLEADTKANSHWMSLYRFYGLRPPLSSGEAVDVGVSSGREVDNSLRRIAERYDRWVGRSRPALEEQLRELLRKFEEYGIRRTGERMAGPAVVLSHYEDIYPAGHRAKLKSSSHQADVKEYAQFMLRVAETFRSAEDPEVRQRLEGIFMDLLDHLRDQGWAAGSGLGTLHHLGYNLRSYYTALYLMKDVLKAYGKLEACREDMYWFSGAGRIFTDSTERSGGIIDIFNTTLGGMLATILMFEEPVEQVRHLQRLSGWVARYLLPAPGLMSCFKSDGSAFHHAGHYPAYAVGGFRGVAPVVYVLSGTPFRIPETAHASLRKALLAMRLYCNKTEWLLSLSARHPTGEGALSTEPFKYLALAGAPDGTEDIDREIAAAYLRLLSPGEDETARRFKAAGIAAEPEPQGHWTMNYAALSLHRRDNWLVGVRGHSRYLWANESYLNANLYGRYVTYGQVQILGRGDPVNNRDSGFAHNGWDWNRWPGTTAIRLPLERLRADVRNVDAHSGFEEMLLSDETYAGGLHLANCSGMFAIKLHGHPKYGDSLRARKSVFFFDNRMVLLGSSIENDAAGCPTETTLFQCALTHHTDAVWFGRMQEMNAFPFASEMLLERPSWMVDNKGNGYYLPAGQRVGLSRRNQQSRSQRSGEETHGDFAAAWLSHGSAPQGEQYEYAIVVGADAAQMQRFAAQMSQPQTAPYRVLRKDNRAHIVQDAPSGTTGYALFEAGELAELPDDCPLRAVNVPCMAMTRVDGGRLTMSIVDPDLRLYSGTDPDQYDAEGNRKEVSVYSRPWISDGGAPSHVQVVLKGGWRLAEDTLGCRILSVDGRYTTLDILCKEALPVEMKLLKVNRKGKNLHER